MYTLIADSGSTKTDWVLLNGKDIIVDVKTAGLNPYFQSKHEIESAVLSGVRPALEKYIFNTSHIFYYGAGCSTSENCKIIEDALRLALGVQKIDVNHDLLAAARALCSREWGIASILGTGSNSCLYNGEEILENVPSTGYLWSDYGGGSQIGKYLIRDYFEEAMPADLRVHFEEAG